MSAGDYKDIAEFVESIPYTETREYVQAILRNRTLYQAVYTKHNANAAASAKTELP
jgi:soluble lytic murein transglycosylase